MLSSVWLVGDLYRRARGLRAGDTLVTEGSFLLRAETVESTSKARQVEPDAAEIDSLSIGRGAPSCQVVGWRRSSTSDRCNPPGATRAVTLHLLVESNGPAPLGRGVATGGGAWVRIDA